MVAERCSHGHTRSQSFGGQRWTRPLPIQLHGRSPTDSQYVLVDGMTALRILISHGCWRAVNRSTIDVIAVYCMKGWVARTYSVGMMHNTINKSLWFPLNVVASMQRAPGRSIPSMTSTSETDISNGLQRQAQRHRYRECDFRALNIPQTEADHRHD